MIDLTEFITRSRDERRQHLALEEPCCERGGCSTHHKGVLAQYLNTTIPLGRILLCHACNNSKCSNPRHLYWGTDYDNIVIDGKEFGTHASPFQRRIEKYGYEKACAMNSRVGNTYGSGNKGKAKSEQHKKNIAKNQKGGRPKVDIEATMAIFNEHGLKGGAIVAGVTYDTFKARVLLAKKKLTTNQ